jgi:hypothetical protein
MQRKKKGDPLYHSEVNELAKAAKKVGSIRGGNGIRVRNLANGITISAEHKDQFWGIVVCRGPNGEEDFDDNRYWVHLSYVSNNSTDPYEKTTLEKEPEESPKYEIVAVTNWDEDNCETHIVKPGTRVFVSLEYDQSSPPIPRYTLIRADVGQCRPETCDSSSSSPRSSSSPSSSPSSKSSESSQSSQSSKSESSKSQSSQSQSSQSQSQSNSNSQSNSTSGSNTSDSNGSNNDSNGSGSNKSTAIVPASWSPTGYTALFIAEGPEVRFDDVIVEWTQQKNTAIAIDPKFLEVCEPDSVEVCGCVANVPVTVGAMVNGTNVEVSFSRQTKKCVRLVIRLTGIRKGFKGMRFEDRTAEQFRKNEAFINSAY